MYLIKKTPGSFTKKAFTLMEIMVSIAILWIISSAALSVFTSLIYEWKKDKTKIEMNAEIVDSIAIVKKYIKESDELKILDSEIRSWDLLSQNILWKKLNWILIKNKDLEKNDEERKSLFTLIKPLDINLSWDFWVKSAWKESFHLWITDLNLFSDVVKFWDKIVYSDPWNWNIWVSWDFWERILFWWNNSPFLTPTWLLITNDNLFISDTYQNLIFAVKISDFNSPDLLTRNSSLRVIAWKQWVTSWISSSSKNNEIISWFQDWNLWINTLNHPKWFALFDNKLYFADSWNNAVRVLDLSTLNVESFIWNWKPWISEDWVFHQEFLLNSPSDIDINWDIWMVIVSDTNNNRIIASWPFSWKNSYSKPFTISWVWKTELKNFSDWFFNLDDKFIWSNSEIINEEKNVWWMWFWWDFFLSNNAILNHPTWVKFYSNWGFIFSDSWNNLIRKVSIWDFWNWWNLSLFDNNNHIETIIWNTSEVLVKEWENADWSWDIRFSTSAPKSWNKSWDSKSSFLDNPMWLSFSWSDILFSDLEIYKKRLYWKVNLCDWDCLKWKWDLTFLINKAFNALSVDKISITNLWDFISKTPLDIMQFTEKSLNNWSKKLISIYLKFIDYLKGDDNVFIDIKTSVEIR